MRKWVFHHLLLWDILSVYVLVSGMLTFRSSFDTVQFDLPFRIEWTGLTPNGPVSLKLVKVSNELELDITTDQFDSYTWSPGPWYLMDGTILKITAYSLNGDVANSSEFKIRPDPTMMVSSTIETSISSTMSVSSLTQISVASIDSPVISLSDQLATADSNGAFMVGTQSLLPGGAVTVSGRIYTLPSANTVATSTSTLNPKSATPVPTTPDPSASTSYPLRDTTTLNSTLGTSSKSLTPTLNGQPKSGHVITAAIASSTPTPTNSNSLMTDVTRESLPVRAKIGIGVGASIVFLIFTTLLALFFFRYGKRYAQARQCPNPSTPPLDKTTSRPMMAPIDILACRIKNFPQEPYELWSPTMNDLKKKGNTELEGCQVGGLIETKKGKRAELDGRMKIPQKAVDGELQSKSDGGNWLSNWGRWVDRV